MQSSTIVVAVAVVAALLSMLYVRFRSYAIRKANESNTNWGNMLDRVMLLYIAAEGDPRRFRSLRAEWLPNTSMYGDRDFPLDVSDVRPPRRMTPTERAFVGAFFAPLYRWAVLWNAATSAKQLARAYARRCLELRVAAVRGDDPELATTIVVHFRCSDVPFIRLPLYYMYSCEWYARALQAAFARESETLGPGRAFRRILLVTCPSHIDPAGPLSFLMPKEDVVRERCAHFRDQYTEFFRRTAQKAGRNLPVTTACGTQAEDLYRMNRAGCLIACTGSFAYYAGYLSDNLFLVPDLFANGHVRPGMVMVPSGANGRISHLSVRDYLDGPEMDGHLKCK
jgi:hypothetical protein